MKNRITTSVLLLVLILLCVGGNVSAEASRYGAYNKVSDTKTEDKDTLDEWIKGRDSYIYFELNIRDIVANKSTGMTKVTLPKFISSVELSKTNVYADTTEGFSVFIETFNNSKFIDKYIQYNEEETTFNGGEIDIWYESEELNIICNTYEDYKIYDIITYMNNVGVVYSITDYNSTSESKEKVIEYMNELGLSIKIA